MQNPAVLVVEDLLRRVDADGGLELADGAVRFLGANGEITALAEVTCQGSGETLDVEGLLARQS